MCIFAEKELPMFHASGFIAGPPTALSFVQGIKTRPFGVLGQQMTLTKDFLTHAPEPAAVPGCCFVDPAGLHHIQPPGGPSGAHGAAGAIYKSIGISNDASFPADVIEAVKKTGDAKYHGYAKEATGETVHVIHAVGPDLRKDFDPEGAPGVGFTRAQGVEALGRAYKNILVEFLASGQPMLRLLPVSGGIFAGAFMDEIPALTWEALQAGFGQLSSEEQFSLTAKEVDMCIFAEKELPMFHASGFIAPLPTELSSAAQGFEKDNDPSTITMAGCSVVAIVAVLAGFYFGQLK